MSYEILDDINSLHANLIALTSRTNNNNNNNDNNNNNNNENDIFEQLDNMIIRPFNNDFVLFIYHLLIHHDNNNHNKATTIKILSLLLTYNIEKYNIFHLTTVESIKLLFTLMERYDNNHHQYEIPIIIIEWIHKSVLYIFNMKKTGDNDIFDRNYQSTQELKIYTIIDYLVVTIASDDLSLSHTSYSLIELIIIHSTENNNNSSINDKNNNNERRAKCSPKISKSSAGLDAGDFGSKTHDAKCPSFNVKETDILSPWKLQSLHVTYQVLQ